MNEKSTVTACAFLYTVMSSNSTLILLKLSAVGYRGKEGPILSRHPAIPAIPARLQSIKASLHAIPSIYQIVLSPVTSSTEPPHQEVPCPRAAPAMLHHLSRHDSACLPRHTSQLQSRYRPLPLSRCCHSLRNRLRPP